MIVSSGQSVVLDRPGLAVVYAFKDAIITVGAGLQLPAPQARHVDAEREPAQA
jgi:hypothetical protein